MGRPGRGGDEIVVDQGAGQGDFHIRAADSADFWGDGGVGGDTAMFQDVGGGQDLEAVANGGDGFGKGKEVPDDFQNALVEPQIFRGAAAWDDEGIILGQVDVVERGGQGEVVPWLLGVGLIAFEVVNGGADFFAGGFSGTNGIDPVPEHSKGLEWDHDFVVFDEVARQEQDFFGHEMLEVETGASGEADPTFATRTGAG